MTNNLWYLTRYPYTLLADQESDADYLREFAPGEEITFSGPQSALILTEGHVRILQHDPAAGMVTLDVLNPRDILGCLGEPSEEEPLQAIAMDVCTAYALPRTVLEERAQAADLPPIEVTLRALGSRRSLRVDVKDLLFQSARARVARALLMLPEPQPPTDERSPSPCIPLPIWQLAELAGLGREATRLALKAWESKGWVKTGWGSIRAILAEPLREEAGWSAGSGSIEAPRKCGDQSGTPATQPVKGPAAESYGRPTG